MLPKPGKASRAVRYLGVGIVSLLIFTLCALPASAQGSSTITQGFKTTDPNIVPGALVGQKAGTTNTVELSDSSKLGQLLGVAGSRSLIELSSGVGTVQVLTNGTASALVSDINGAVKVGDRITPSPIAGVGMKATSSTLVIGIAEGDLSANARTQSVTNTKGKRQIVHIGTIPLQVDKVYFQPKGEQVTFLPAAVQGFASSIAGHEVSSTRIVISGLVVILLFLVIATLLYSTVKSSIISIGRNPLSETAVHKSLLEVGITVSGVLVFTVVVIYLILTT